MHKKMATLSLFHKIINLVDSFKESLQDNEYKDLLDSLSELKTEVERKSTEYCEVVYLFNKLKLNSFGDPIITIDKETMIVYIDTLTRLDLQAKLIRNGVCYLNENHEEIISGDNCECSPPIHMSDRKVVISIKIHSDRIPSFVNHSRSLSNGTFQD